MTLHIPQKDSPSTYLTTAIEEDDKNIVVADSSIFSAANITRLTLGYDTATTETVTVVSYKPNNTIEVQRGTPAYIWAAGTTKVARVFTSYDLLEIHHAISDINTIFGVQMEWHDHQGGNGAQIPTEGIQNEAITTAKIQNEAITTAKIQNRRRRVHLSSMGNASPAVANSFVHGPRIKYSPTDPKYVSFYGTVPNDFLSDGILYVLFSPFLSMTPVDAHINVGVTRFSMDSYMGGFMDLQTTLNVPGLSIGETHYIIRTKAIPLDNIAAEDYIIGGARLGPEAGGIEVTYEGAYLDYLADS